MKTEAVTGVTPPQAKGCQGWWQPPEARKAGRAFPQGLQRESGPPDTLMWDFRPQNCERTRVCRVKTPPVHFVRAAPDTQTQVYLCRPGKGQGRSEDKHLNKASV